VSRKLAITLGSRPPGEYPAGHRAGCGHPQPAFRLAATAEL